MMLPPEAQREAAVRLAASQGERRTTREYVARGEILKANRPDRIERRKVRLLADQSMTQLLGAKNREALAAGPVAEAPAEARDAFEAAIGGKDTQHCWFLTRGVEIRRTVGRLHIRDAYRRTGWGTGFLVAPNLLLTNQHVLDSLQTARHSYVEFDFEETYGGDVLPSAIFDLAPDTFFVSDPAVGGRDYALVAVRARARADSRRPDALLAEFGYNVLVREQGKLAKGELIYCIHHPEGQARQVNLRENRLMALDEPKLKDTWLHYETDTERGSSGAPLFNYEWVVVGVHHMAVEKRDAAGNILALGGEPWKPEMGERRKWWDANEGLRISRFLDDVEEKVRAALSPNPPANAGHVVTEQGQALFEAMLKPSRQAPPPAPVVPAPLVGAPSAPSAPPAPPAPRPAPRFNPE